MPNKRKPRPGSRNDNHGDLLADPVNLRILAELQQDPRISMSELGRRVALSAPAVTERVQRLERARVIAGYRLQLDPAALGYGVAAFVRVRPGPGQLPRVAELASGIPEVSECYRITGDDCFIMKLHVAGVEELETVLDRFLLHGQTNTSIVQSTVVEPRALPLPGV
jgi:Lrp/AsnC family transcriptional regulator, leucine-responsive regulatory protein